MKKVFLKYLLHIICDKVALNVFQFCRDKNLFSEDDDREVGAEKSQDEETQLDEYHNPPDGVGAEKSQDEDTQSDEEYHNPPDAKSPHWDPAWILGIIIITINVPLPRYPLHTLFIFAYIKYGQAKAKAGLKEYIAKKMVFAHTTPTEHSRDSVLNVEQPTTS